MLENMPTDQEVSKREEQGRRRQEVSLTWAVRIQVLEWPFIVHCLGQSHVDSGLCRISQ